ncbi:MAG: adenylate cyclase [Parasphingorhabdus sp.]|jgi:adenylate cyclase
MAPSQPQQVEHTQDTTGANHLTFEPFLGRVIGVLDKKVIVDSKQAMQLREGRLSPVFYFHRDDVRMDLLELSDLKTFCPFRGHASYFHARIGDKLIRDVAWSYTDPFKESSYVKDYVALHTDRLDDLKIEEDSDTADHAELDTSHNPLIGWLLEDAWQATSISDLVTRFIRKLNLCGMPLLRFALITRTLHPQLLGSNYRWDKGGDGVLENELHHQTLETSQYLNSPLYPIFEGAGGVRRRLHDGSVDDFPVLADIRDAGGTDYVAMPLVFSDGQINAITLATDRPGGFDTNHLSSIYEVLPIFSRLVEVFLQRDKSVTLLGTYLGKHSGQKVLEGQIKRGDGEDIHAVIWFCDLRDSSGLARKLSRVTYLRLLNCFFDCMAGSVLDHDGEVLSFIGDAALAIFPLDDRKADDGSPLACYNALAAAKDAIQRVKNNNAENKQTLDFGIGLHIGDVTHGNIGTDSRLQFTVIGAAANEASRIESLCKTIKSPLLISEAFVQRSGGQYVDLGQHELRGTGLTTTLYRPDWCSGTILP